MVNINIVIMTMLHSELDRKIRIEYLDFTQGHDTGGLPSSLEGRWGETGRLR